MNPDPVLEGLVAAGAFAIAADRYEEETDDTELAALMRIPGLEWELVDGKPGLKVVFTYNEIARNFWWDVRCGGRELGTILGSRFPELMKKASVRRMLQDAGYGIALAPRLYQLCREAVDRTSLM